MNRVTFNRRQVGLGLAASVALPVSARLLPAGAMAQDSNIAAGTAWQQLQDLTAEAQRLGLAVPRMSAAPSAASGAYEEAAPALVDFMDSIEASAGDAPDVATEDVESLIDRASEALRTMRNAEKMPREIEEPGARMGAAAFKIPEFDDKMAEQYRTLFATCEIKDAKRSDVMWAVSKITDPTRRASYDRIYEETCVPWFFVAILHGMEAGFDMNSHLHNGDSLKKKTWQVPAGRPPVWNPPNDWASSAIDAMKYDKLDEKADWDLARMLYRMEGYNGWRSRVLYGINTPYLWSYSQHYTKGKFVADNVWDKDAVSRQCGGAVMLKALVETGAIAPPA